MQSEEEPLIQPSATFSPYDLAKGRRDLIELADVHRKLFNQHVISHRVENKSTPFCQPVEVDGRLAEDAFVFVI